MKVLFLNPSKQRCGVHQYGKRLFAILCQVNGVEADYAEIEAPDPWELNPGWLNNSYDVVLYNLHPGINNFMCFRPKRELGRKHVGIFHEAPAPRGFDAWVFSGPDVPFSADAPVYLIGRPLPQWEAKPRTIENGNGEVLTVGLSGFVGAWASEVVKYVTNHVTDYRIRIALPPSDHCDPAGGVACSSADVCRGMVPDPSRIEVTHYFMTEPGLLQWLEANDINCYIRPPLPSVGVSSALDMALAVNRPIAINRSTMFRHLFDAQPSICVDDRNIMEIYRDGLSPLVSHRRRHSNSVVAQELADALSAIAS